MDEDDVSPYERFLAGALDRCLDELIQTGQLELDEASRPMLHADLLDAATRAETPKRMFKALVRTLVGSDHVEEIYASDDELREIFEAAIGQT